MNTKNDYSERSVKYKLYSSGEEKNNDILNNVFMKQRRYKINLIKDECTNNENNINFEKENSILLKRITKALKTINSREE